MREQLQQLLPSGQPPLHEAQRHQRAAPSPQALPGVRPLAASATLVRRSSADRPPLSTAARGPARNAARGPLGRAARALLECRAVAAQAPLEPLLRQAARRALTEEPHDPIAGPWDPRCRMPLRRRSSSKRGRRSNASASMPCRRASAPGTRAAQGPRRTPDCLPSAPTMSESPQNAGSNFGGRSARRE